MSIILPSKILTSIAPKAINIDYQILHTSSQSRNMSNEVEVNVQLVNSFREGKVKSTLNKPNWIGSNRTPQNGWFDLDTGCTLRLHAVSSPCPLMESIDWIKFAQVVCFASNSWLWMWCKMIYGLVQSGYGWFIRPEMDELPSEVLIIQFGIKIIEDETWEYYAVTSPKLGSKSTKRRNERRWLSWWCQLTAFNWTELSKKNLVRAEQVMS